MKQGKGNPFSKRVELGSNVVKPGSKGLKPGSNVVKPGSKGLKPGSKGVKANPDQYRVDKLLKHQSTMNDKAIDAFRKALDKAVKIATIKNIPPIKGVTVIICSAGNFKDFINNVTNI